MKNLLLFLLLLAVAEAYAQVPTTNVYLFDYRTSEDGKVLLKAPRIITAGNINGYNNQPKWFNDRQLFITRQKAGADQTDLVIYDQKVKTETLFTKTRQSEYSATPTPDGKHLSCIRVEDDGTQVLWQYPLDRSHKGKRILSHIKDIGYHFWISETELVLFILGNPMKLVLANTTSTDVENVSTKIGRCFGQFKNDEVLFVYKYTEDIWHLKSLNTSTQRARFIAETPKGSEDFVLLDDGTILMGQGPKLLRMKAPYTDWEEISDLSTYDIQGISRMAYRNGILALVGH